jgi:hypothetical protein
MTSSVKYSDSRFLQLSEKISRLQNIELRNSDNQTRIESKIDKLEKDFRRVSKDYENKYNFIYDEIQTLSKIIINNREERERLKIKNRNEFSDLEEKIKEMFDNENEYMTTSMNNLFINIEDEVERVKTFNKRENEIIQDNVQQFKSFSDKELFRLNSEYKGLSEESKKKIEFIKNILKEEFSFLESKVIYHLYR